MMKRCISMGAYTFSKEHRLLKRKDFVNLNRLGTRDHTTHFTVILKENGLGINRVGITVTKKIGNAVKRNRIKRLAREFFRLHQHSIPHGYDIVIVAKKGAADLFFRKLKEELGEILLDKKFLL